METKVQTDYIYPQEEGVDIKKYLFVIFKKRWIFISIVTIVMVSTLVYTNSQIPIYRATSLVLIERPASSVSKSAAAEQALPEIGAIDYYNTQYEIIKSKMMAKRVAKALDLGSLPDFPVEVPENKFRGLIRVNPVRKSRLVKVHVVYEDPVMATKMVNTLVNLYVEQNIENMLFMSKDLLKAFPEESEDIKRHTIYGQLKELSKEEIIDSLPSIVNNAVLQNLRLEKITIETELANLSRRYKKKHPKIIALDTKLKFIEDKIKMEKNRVLASLRADLAGKLQINNIRVIDYAQIPGVPISPQKKKNIMYGMVLSMSLGLGIIFLTEYLDDTVKDQDDIERQIKLPYLGDFPVLRRKLQDLKGAVWFQEIDKRSEASEAIRNLRTNIIFSTPQGGLKTILLTSAVPQEGKSLVCGFLGYSFSKIDVKTLIIDGDIRRPKLHDYFKIDKSPGLTNILVENAPIEKAIKKTSYNNLFILPSGSKTPNPLELLGSDKMKQLMNELSTKFEKIMIDSPPAFALSDALVLSKLSNATIIVTKLGTVSTDVISKLKERFENIDSKIIGVIINFFRMERASYHKYRYYHKYYKEYESPDANKAASREKNKT